MSKQHDQTPLDPRLAADAPVRDETGRVIGRVGDFLSDEERQSADAALKDATRRIPSSRVREMLGLPPYEADD